MDKLKYNYYGKWYPRIDSFAKAKELYDSIRPINGSLRKLWMDVRPIKYRARHWERIWKVNRDEYAVGHWYSWSESYERDNPKRKLINRLVSYRRDGEIRVHQVKYYSTNEFNMINQVLPDGVTVERRDAIVWLLCRAEDNTVKYFRFPKRGPLRLRREGSNGWSVSGAPDVPRYRYDRTTAKKLKQDVWEFREYVRCVWPMLDEEIINKQAGRNSLSFWSLDDPEVLKNAVSDRSLWLPLVSYAKLRSATWHWDRVTGTGGYTYANTARSLLETKIDRAITREHKDKFLVEMVPPGEYVPRNRRFE